MVGDPSKVRIPVLVNHKEVLAGDTLLYLKRDEKPKDKDVKPISQSKTIEKLLREGTTQSSSSEPPEKKARLG